MRSLWPEGPSSALPIDIADIFHRYPIPPLHDGMVPQAGEEGLHMVGDTEAQRVVHRLGYAVLNR